MSAWYVIKQIYQMGLEEQFVMITIHSSMDNLKMERNMDTECLLTKMENTFSLNVLMANGLEICEDPFNTLISF